MWFKKLTLICSLTVFASVPVSGAEPLKPKPLGLKQFIEKAAANDKQFEAILIEQLGLQYRRDLLLPDSDFIFDIKYQHNFYLDQDRDNPEASIALSKLFTDSGTELSLSYGKDSSVFSNSEASSLEVLVSQPIANNAFGKANQLQERIIGIENSVSRYQVIEAYEDYLASLTTIYYNWYSAYQNLELGKRSLRSNQKLMDNILARQRQNIALPVDVNKMRLLLLGREESLVSLQEVYDTYSNLVHRSIAVSDSTAFIPLAPSNAMKLSALDNDIDSLVKNGRSFQVFNLLAQQGSLEVEQVADELMPSTRLLFGYRLDGEEWAIDNQQDNLFAGITLSWPLGHTVNNAKKQLAQIAQRKTEISNASKLDELKTSLKNIALQIRRQQKLLDIAGKKITLSEAVLKDEAENYSFGKISLNDYITAVNRVDESRFSFTAHKVELNKLMVEWLRLSDQLVDESVLKTPASQ